MQRASAKVMTKQAPASIAASRSFGIQCSLRAGGRVVKTGGQLLSSERKYQFLSAAPRLAARCSLLARREIDPGCSFEFIIIAHISRPTPQLSTRTRTLFRLEASFSQKERLERPTSSSSGPPVNELSCPACFASSRDSTLAAAAAVAAGPEDNVNRK